MLPIIFLTASQELSSRLESLRAGGDDFLVKPLSPPLLLTAVAGRLERGRSLLRLLERDGLTELLTHTAFMERLAAVTPKGRRAAPNLALALLDLDHFKWVNDTYGHPSGDRVLRSLSAFLRRRLRSYDAIGRVGGEEFGIVLEDLDTEEAQRLVERLLEEFDKTEQTATDGRRFHITFSAGIAHYDRRLTSLQWFDQADRALYAAKKAGRGRVVMSSESDRPEAMLEPPLLVDQSVIEGLRQVGGEVFLRDVVETFLSDAAGRIAAMRENQGRSDYEAIRRSAHSLKSSCGNVGAVRLADLCRLIESLATERADTSALLGQAETAFRDAAVLLRNCVTPPAPGQP